jgi:hypothetical protein
MAKPPICNLCGKPGWADSLGEWLAFKNYKPCLPNEDGHPFGFEYYCAAHFDAARQLTHLNDDDALAELKKTLGAVQWVRPEHPKTPWYKKLFNRS